MGSPSLTEDDVRRQSHRLRRFQLGCAGVIMAHLLYLVCHLAGALDERALVNVAATSTLLVLAFYAILRSNLNLRLADPSMTLPMIVASTMVMLYVISQAQAMRTELVLLYVVPFLFGMFRLRTITMLVVAAIFLLGYAFILSNSNVNVVDSHPNNLALARWTITAVTLGWLALFTGYLARLRKRLMESNAQLADALKQVQQLVSNDELTGVYNRRHMNIVLELEKSRSDRSGDGFCIFMMDLDHFKSINDRHGHAVGDSVLRLFADNMRPILRPTDFFGRIGGEEFLVVSTDTGIEGALILAERLRSRCELLQVPEMPESFRITVSIGITQYRRGEPVERAMRRADSALYAAKQKGRNQVEIGH